MISALIHYFKRFDFPVSTHSLGIFRILYSIYNLGLLLQLYLHWPIYFDHIPPFSFSIFPAKLSLFLWFIANLFLLFGLFTRYAAIVNYVLAVLMAGFFANVTISSFNDDLIRIGGFMLLLLPAGKSFSLDRIATILKQGYQEQKISYLYYLFTILVSLGLLYVGSGFTKLFAPMWQHGIGLWLPAVIPSYKWNSFHFFVDSQWLMYTLNYAVILFELLFVFFLFHKRTHVWLAFIGIFFHLGIALLFPFPYICFGPIIYYSLLIDEAFWKRVQKFLRSKNSLIVRFNPAKKDQQNAASLLMAFNFRNHYHFITDESIASMHVGNKLGWKGLTYACQKHSLLFLLGYLFQLKSCQLLAEYISQHFLANNITQPKPDLSVYRLKRFAFFLFIAALCWVQFLTLAYHTYTAIKADKQKLNQYLKQKIAVQDFSTKPSNLARTFFGINSRGVFLDHAFTGSKTVFALAKVNEDQSETWLPVFDQQGYCTGDNIGFRWHKLSFRYFGKTKTQPDTLGLKKYTWLWAKERTVSPDNMTIRVYRRIYPCPREYEKGYLQKMLALPWDTVGIITWKDSVFSYQNTMPDSLFTQ